MTAEITEKEAIILDRILELTLTLPNVIYEDLKVEFLELGYDESTQIDEFSRLIKFLVPYSNVTFPKDLYDFVEKNSETRDFIRNGGFIKLYRDKLEENKKVKQIKHTTINAKQVIYNEQTNNGNQSLSDNAFDSPTIQKIKKTTDKKPKKSWIELLSWIIGSIASIFAIYEFIIKRLFENN